MDIVAAGLARCLLWRNICIEHQCDVLFIEHRCCGDSEGKYITFGAKEQWDVKQWAVYMAERNKEKLPIYLYGQSMGAASVLMASGHTLPPEVKGLIADCGFQSMERQMRDMPLTGSICIIFRCF